MHWDEFNYAVLETIFGGDLMREAQKKRSNFPHYPHLDEDIDLRLAKEEPITRSLINKWNYTIVAVSLREFEGAFLPCLWREKAGKKLSIGKLPSPVAPGTEGQESKRSRQPDGGSMLLGEIVLKRPGKVYECRYGCILTTAGAFIFRIKPQGDHKGKCTLYKSDLSNRQSSVNLALWFTHILAGNHYKLDWKYRMLHYEELVHTLQQQEHQAKRGRKRKGEEGQEDQDAAQFSFCETSLLKPNLGPFPNPGKESLVVSRAVRDPRWSMASGLFSGSFVGDLETAFHQQLGIEQNDAMSLRHIIMRGNIRYVSIHSSKETMSDNRVKSAKNQACETAGRLGIIYTLSPAGCIFRDQEDSIANYYGLHMSKKSVTTISLTPVQRSEDLDVAISFRTRQATTPPVTPGTMASDAPTYWDSGNSDDEINISMVPPKTQVLIQPLSSLSLSAREGSTETPITVPPSTFPSVSDPFAPLRLTFGEVSEKGSTFVPFKLVRGYPRMYVGKSNQGPVAEFFRVTLLRDRVWDFFSLGDPTARRHSLLLVPTIQFEKYLDIANHELDVNLAIPRGGAGKRFALTFGEFDTPRPRFLGRANGAQALDALKARTDEVPDDDLRRLTPACYQRYLGLRRATPHVPGNSEVFFPLLVAKLTKLIGYRGLVATSWDVSKPAPFKPRESVRFVCVDVEAYERDTRLVTEIGLAVLDTDDVIDKCPGERGENWFSLIQAHHFRIMERSSMVNSEFVQGCPEAFDFGKTHMVPIKDINWAVGNILGNNKPEDRRPVIIVGHDIGQDLKYLLKIGYNSWCAPQIVDEADTQTMFKRIERSPNGRGLAMVCAELGIPGYHYHNAGNDAVHTLRAMITMAIKRTVEGIEGKEEISTPVDEWSDGDMDDGGRPKRSSPPAGEESTSYSNNEVAKDQCGDQNGGDGMGGDDRNTVFYKSDRVLVKKHIRPSLELRRTPVD
ncbi:hypothetical protein CHU98_g10622 [Xylaria longipes]|nr:hypothetical protein CHU98_g10622 [Xylaria longipes]